MANSGCLRVCRILVNKAFGNSVLQVIGNKARKNCQIVPVLPMYMTPLPKRNFGTPPRTVRFPPPLRCQCSVFPVQKSTTEQNRSSFGGVQKFSGERVLWYVFLLPYVLHPPISLPKKIRNSKNGDSEISSVPEHLRHKQWT